MTLLQKKILTGVIIALIIAGITAFIILDKSKNDKTDVTSKSPVAAIENTGTVNAQPVQNKNLSASEQNAIENADVIDLNNADRIIKITEAGTYRFSGTSADTQIYVEYQGDVTLAFDNADITSKEGAVINVQNADILLYLIGENTFTDTANYVFGTDADGNVETEPNAVVYCKDDLVIGGEGSLKINANYKDGIASKNKLSVESGNITINSEDDGIRGKDSVTIFDGTINITSKGDGIKSTNTTDAGLGNIVINGGDITINSESDGIQGVNLLQINDGKVNVANCSEGLESTVVEINGGDVIVNATDDGVNASDKRTEDDTTTSNGGFGGNSEAVIEGVSLTINGGNVNVKGGADGLDSNGIINITGGDVYATGMMSSGIGDISIDSNGAITVTGGNIWTNDVQIVADGQLVENNIGWTLNNNILSSGGMGGFGGRGGMGQTPPTMPNGEFPTDGTMPSGEMPWGDGEFPAEGSMPTMPNGENPWGGQRFNRGNTTTSETVTTEEVI